MLSISIISTGDLLNIRKINDESKLNNKQIHSAKQTPDKMDSYRSSQVQHLRQYIVAIENQLKSYENEHKTLLSELGKFEITNNNMRLEIEYLVEQLRKLDMIIDQKHEEGLRLAKENHEYQMELGRVNEMLRLKVREIEELQEVVKGVVGNSERLNKETKIDKQVMKNRRNGHVQQQKQQMIKQLNSEIDQLKESSSQKDVLINTLNQKLTEFTQALSQKQAQYQQKCTTERVQQQKMYQLKKNIIHNQKQIQSLKYSLNVAEQKIRELQAEQNINKQIVIQQQGLVLSENALLKREKQRLMNEVEISRTNLKELSEKHEQLIQTNQSLKVQIQLIQQRNQASHNSSIQLREAIQFLNQKRSLLQNDMAVLIRQNHQLKQENLKIKGVNEQLEKSITQLRNLKQPPQQQQQHLKLKLKQRIKQMVQKQQQLKKRHWLQIARYANQIDKLKTDLQQKQKQSQQLKKQFTQHHANLTNNQSHVIVNESQKESLIKQVANQWKEKITTEQIQKQKEIDALKSELNDENTKTNKLIQELNLKEQLLKDMQNQLQMKNRDNNIIVVELSSIKEKITNLQEQLQAVNLLSQQKSQQIQQTDKIIVEYKSDAQDLRKNLHGQVTAMKQKLRKEMYLETKEENQQISQNLTIQVKQQTPQRLYSQISIKAKTEAQQIAKNQISQQVLNLKQQLSNTQNQVKRLQNIRLEYKDSLSAYELNFLELQNKLDETEQQKNNMKKMLEDSHAKLIAQKSACAQFYAELLELKGQNKALLTVKKQMKQQKLHEATFNPKTPSTFTHSTQSFLQEQRPYLSIYNQPINSPQPTLKPTIQALMQQIQQLTTNNANLSQQLKQFQQSFEEKTLKLKQKNEELQLKIERYEQQQYEHVEEVNSLKIELENITNQLIQTDQTKKDLLKKLQTLNKQLKQKDAQLKGLTQLNSEATQLIQIQVAKEQTTFNELENHRLKITQLQTELKSHQSIISQNKSLKIKISTFQSQSRTNLQQAQQYQKLIKLKNQEIFQLTMKSDALKLKCNSFFDEIIKKNKQHEQINTFNKKKIAHLTRDLENNKITIADYQAVLIKQNHSLKVMKNQLTQKDAKIETLQRYIQQIKKYHEFINIKPLSQLQQTMLPQKQPAYQIKPRMSEPKQTIPQHLQSVSDNKQMFAWFEQGSPKESISVANYKKILKKVQKSVLEESKSHIERKNMNLKNQKNLFKQFRQESAINSPFKRFADQYTSSPTTPTEYYHNKTLPNSMFTTFNCMNENSFNHEQSQKEQENLLGLLNLCHQEKMIVEPIYNNFQNHFSFNNSNCNGYNNQNDSNRPSRKVSELFQEYLQKHQNGNVQLAKFREGLQKNNDQKNKMQIEKSKSQKLLIVNNNTTKNDKQDKIEVNHNHNTSSLVPINLKTNTTNFFNTDISPINRQKCITVVDQSHQQRSPKVEAEKNPKQKNGVIRKNITHQKVLNEGNIGKNQRVLSRDPEQQTSLRDSVAQSTNSQSKSKLIRTIKSQSEMVKPQPAVIVKNVK